MTGSDMSTPPPQGVPRKCPRCQGRGWIDHRCVTPDQSYVCSYCNGKGFNAAGGECYACHGTGLIEVRLEDKNPCPLCNGAGVFPVPESMTYSQFAFHPGRK